MGTTTVELKFLAWTVVFGLLQVLIAAQLGSQRRGLMWNVGPRDATPQPLTGYAARADRALKNFLETFPFFAAVVLGALATGRASAATALGVQLYFWARLAYFPLYLAGVPFLRTLVWVVSLWGLIKVLWALF